MTRRCYVSCIIVITLLAGCLVMTPVVSSSREADPLIMEGWDKVLILNGFSYGLPVLNANTKAVFEGLQEQGIPLETIMVKNLDLNQNTDTVHRQLMQSMLEYIDRHHEIGVIIAMDWAAVDFMANEGALIFHQTPMISLYNEEPEWLDEPRPLVIVSSSNDSSGTLKHALDLFPKTRQVVIISGKDDTKAPFMEGIINAIEAEAPHVIIETTSDMSHGEMLQHMASLPEGTIGFYGSYFEDFEGQQFTPATVARQVAEKSSIPVFAFIDMHIRQGLVGGSVVVTTELGRQVSQIAMSSLMGETQTGGVLRYEAMFYPMFDWELLTRWKADTGNLPEETIFLNKTPTLWEAYRLVIVFVFVGMLILLTFSMYLWFLNTIQKRTLVKLNEATEKLEYSRHKLDNIIKGTDVGTWEYAVQENSLDINERWAEMLGYTMDDLQPHTIETWRKLVHPDDYPVANEGIQRLFRGELVLYNVEFRMKHRRGDWVWIQSQGSVISWNPNQEPLVVSGMHLDITDRKKTEAMLVKNNLELKEAKKDVDEANKAKGQFLANMSHELRTPINGLMGMNQLLQMTETTVEQDEYLKYSVDACKALTHVIEDVLNFVSLEKYRQPLELVIFSPGELLAEITELYQIVARNKNLNLSVEIAENVSDLVKGDRAKLKQLMGNLVGNALKFTNEGSVTLILEAKPSESPNLVRLFWTVTDTGIGVEADKIQHLFDQFYQVDNTDTRQYGGVGLGLSIVANLARVMGGKVLVRSEHGKGSCFTYVCDYDLV